MGDVFRVLWRTIVFSSFYIVLNGCRIEAHNRYVQGVISIERYNRELFSVSFCLTLLWIWGIVAVCMGLLNDYNEWKERRITKEDEWDKEFHEKYFEILTKGVNRKYHINKSCCGEERAIEEIFELKDKNNKEISLVRTTKIYKQCKSVDVNYEFYQNGALKDKIESTVWIDTSLFNKSNFKIFINTKLQNNLKSILKTYECRLRGMRR